MASQNCGDIRQIATVAELQQSCARIQQKRLRIIINHPAAESSLNIQSTSLFRLQAYPALGICGFSGSGKTTLIEQAIPHLRAKGLKVAVIKHDVHGIQIDRQGKDSDRLFRAGADLLLQGPEEIFFHAHGHSHPTLTSSLKLLLKYYDLVLVEGHKDTPLAKVWLLGEGESLAPSDKQNILATFPRDQNRVTDLLALLDEWLPQQVLSAPVYGCVLFGGKSTRMGRAKHLLKKNGRTWLENTVELLQQVTEKVVIAGQGRIPGQLSAYPCLADIPVVTGPLSGMLAAMRWSPDVSWLVIACDMPDITLEAVNWLLIKRRPGIWGILPRLPGSKHVEPLFAYYDRRATGILERMVVDRDYSPRNIAAHSKIVTPTIPSHLCGAWRNVNSKIELDRSNKL